jgi:DNA-binding CsgD family transcriptional regulator
MHALDPDLQEAVHRLWDELADFEASQTAEAARHLQAELCRLSGVWNARWAAGVRVNRAYGDDPLQGWRLIGPQLLHPISPQPADARTKEMMQLWDRRRMSASFLLPMRGVGWFRTYSFRRELPPDWFNSPFYEHFYGSRGVYDAVFVGFPLNPNAESHFGFYARERFTDEQIALYAYTLRGIKWFHRRMMLSQGLLIASSPLTATEQRILTLLLTDVQEKEIAEQLDQAASSVHQYIHRHLPQVRRPQPYRFDNFMAKSLRLGAF